MKKDIILVVLALVCVGLVSFILINSDKADKLNKSLDEERYSRMVAEESLQKNAAKLATLEAQLKSANDSMKRVQDQIGKERNLNADLQKQYEDLTKTKADLEEKLKNTMNENKTIVEQQAAPATQ